MGDIIPNSKSFLFNKRKAVGSKENRAPVELGNVTEKVQNAILAVLDMFFACKCTEYTDNQINRLKELGIIMEVHIKVLWTLKQAILYESPKPIVVRKLHSQRHIPARICLFGPIWYADTSDWESCHKIYTTEVWRGTSRRKSTIEKEMLNATVVQSHSRHLEFRNILLEESGAAQFQKTYGPNNENEDLIFNPFSNIADIRFIVTKEKDDRNNNILKGTGLHREKFKETLFKHSGLSNSSQLSQQLRKLCYQEMWNKISEENTMYEFSIVRAATYEGSTTSGVGSGAIYAMSKENRYDYVNVLVSYTDALQVAQVLSIIQLHHMKLNNKNKRINHSTRWFFIIQYMVRTSEEENKHEYISRLKWETVLIENKKQRKFNVDIVSLSSIAGFAMVIPFFSNVIKKKF